MSLFRRPFVESEFTVYIYLFPMKGTTGGDKLFYFIQEGN